jgi:hypothetical protein
MNDKLPSYAFCESFPTVLRTGKGDDLDTFDFIDSADFHAMAINYVIEKEMGLI